MRLPVRAASLLAASLVLVGGLAAPSVAAPGELLPELDLGGLRQPVPAPEHGAADGRRAAAAGITPPGRFVPMESTRVIDTRDPDDSVLGPGEGRWYDFSDVPAGIVALVMNVTATQGTASTSFVSVVDANFEEAVPTTSAVNSSAGRDVANLVTVPIVGDRTIGLYNNSGSTHVIVDVQGFYAAFTDLAAGYVPVAPSRVLDTRESAPLGPQGLRHLTLDDAPDGAVAAAVTLTSTQATARTSYVSAGAYDPAEPDSVPTGSVLNAYQGSDVPNLAIVPVSDDNRVTLYNDQGSTHLIVDVVGWYVAGGGASYVPISSQRAVGSGWMGPQDERNFTPASAQVPVPDDAVAIALNLTTAGATAPSYLTVYPGGTARPLASNANARVGADVAAGTFTRVGSGFTVYNDSGSLLALVDVQGYFADVE
ncbi:hypothetical protein [Cellulomonas sp. NS3]|uniref:hypothetical protein n=1 Tax=Cellulomonas sp. NS3 TaxID=2973977 RepID=UPI0021636284|nr:hypothetical protein [Cellulomonas sp. NS3]